MNEIANHMFDWSHQVPPPVNLGELLVCRRGTNDVRRAKFDEHNGWRFTDCTHPLQNVVCDIRSVYAWREPRK